MRKMLQHFNHLWFLYHFYITRDRTLPQISCWMICSICKVLNWFNVFRFRSLFSSLLYNVGSWWDTIILYGVSSRTIQSKRCHYMLGTIGTFIERSVSIFQTKHFIFFHHFKILIQKMWDKKVWIVHHHLMCTLYP